MTSAPFNHTVSVVLPSTQRSWIGKAHLLPPSVYPVTGSQQQQQQPAPRTTNEAISDDIIPTYYDPSTATTHPHPPTSPTQPYYVLIPGTPATCAQLGLFHHATLFPHNRNGPVDLVVSGPNHGRNTTAAFALSSGTLGGALEAAICGVRAVAISFAFTTRKEPEELVAEASALSVRVVERLARDWAGELGGVPGPDLYTVNVPLVEGVGGRPARWTWMLDNKWSKGSLYKVVDKAGGDGGSEGKDRAALDSVDEMKRRGDGQGGSNGADQTAAATAPSFKWAPTFADVWSTVLESAEGNDGLTVKDGFASVTPLRANFEGLYGKGGFHGDMKL